MAIRAVFYDLDGTLRIGRPSGRQFFADYAAKLGLVFTPQVLRLAARWEHYYWAESPEKQADGLQFPDNKAFWVNYGRRQMLELGASPELADRLAPQINDYMEKAFRPDDVLMDGDRLHETLANLRGRGITLGVISNRHEPFGEYLRELGIAGYFDLVLAAGEVNSWKPAKKIFAHALGRVNITARETVYVGDNYYADVVGARNAGMNPVLIDPEGLFDAPGCPVIRTHSEILAIIERSESWPGNEK
jgi:FMN phosphatase YigB (HAD superfamily)